VRRVCVNCKEELEVAQQALIDAGYTPEEAKTTKIYHGKGCSTCNKRGYKAARVFTKVMEINDELRELILVGAFGAGTEEESHRAGHDHPAAQWFDKGCAWTDHHGRSPA